ncbi:MAG TPA: hypothetical protein VEZ55_15270 [Chitinophagaceae bacterium]|nr:hypothetical protein [Chitinophagaceae bacterium]
MQEAVITNNYRSHHGARRQNAEILSRYPESKITPVPSISADRKYRKPEFSTWQTQSSWEAIPLSKTFRVRLKTSRNCLPKDSRFHTLNT